MNEQKKRMICEQIMELAKKDLGMNPVGVVLFVFQQKPEEKCSIAAVGKWALQPIIEFILRTTP